jgi:hypothetical protein
LVITANVVPSLPILVTLIMEMKRSTETLIIIRATRRHIPEDDIFHYELWFYYTALTPSSVPPSCRPQFLSKLSSPTEAVYNFLQNTYILTNSVELSTAREATTCAATR